MNGVNRGGAYDNTNHAQYTRICYRQQRVSRGLAVWVGFRLCEWCKEGWSI